MVFNGYLTQEHMIVETVQIAAVAANKQMENVVCGLYLIKFHKLLLRFGQVEVVEQDTPVIIAVASVLEVQEATMQSKQ